MDKDLGDGTGSPPTRSSLRPHRLALLACAWVFLAIGIAGVFLPLVPGTLFLILAAACFTRSSPRFEAWLLDHPRFGPPVRAWREKGTVPRRGKVFAGASLAASWLILVATGASAAVGAVTLALFLAVGLFVATRPEA
jgi:uncharacterized protein